MIINITYLNYFYYLLHHYTEFVSQRKNISKQYEYNIIMNIIKGIACKGVITQKSYYNIINLNVKLTFLSTRKI